MTDLTIEQVTPVFARHAALYRKHPATYQTAMLNGLRAVWQGHHQTLLDVGGGTGIMASAMRELLPVGEVHAVDVVDRYFPDLPVKTHVYDGMTMPFADGAFDAATINNVLHHVPAGTRSAVLAEVRRVVSGPVYIKDHVAASALDHARLFLLDAIGNIPFGGMVKAQYLSQQDWADLAAAAGYGIGDVHRGHYRAGIMSALFPNDLEICIRLDRL